MKITIAGYGFVGKAHEAVLLKKQHEVNIVDPKLGAKRVYDTNPEAVMKEERKPKTVSISELTHLGILGHTHAFAFSSAFAVIAVLTALCSSLPYSI